MPTINQLVLQQAAADIDTITNVVNGSAILNGDGTVTSRLGNVLKTLARVIDDLEAITLSNDNFNTLNNKLSFLTNGLENIFEPTRISLQEIFPIGEGVWFGEVDTRSGLSTTVGILTAFQNVRFRIRAFGGSSPQNVKVTLRETGVTGTIIAEKTVPFANANVDGYLNVFFDESIVSALSLTLQIQADDEIGIYSKSRDTGGITWFAQNGTVDHTWVDPGAGPTEQRQQWAVFGQNGNFTGLSPYGVQTLRSQLGIV